MQNWITSTAKIQMTTRAAIPNLSGLVAQQMVLCEWEAHAAHLHKQQVHTLLAQMEHMSVSARHLRKRSCVCARPAVTRSGSKWVKIQ